ncbi:hypothetical protein M422DRAFT_247012 [Sphaerobolus stellatus SS14]|nr:hypothetical protein M422DRAFT_247012 [Sphaerobolus stellatus SS14]
MNNSEEQFHLYKTIDDKPLSYPPLRDFHPDRARDPKPGDKGEQLRGWEFIKPRIQRLTSTVQDPPGTRRTRIRIAKRPGEQENSEDESQPKAEVTSTKFGRAHWHGLPQQKRRTAWNNPGRTTESISTSNAASGSSGGVQGMTEISREASNASQLLKMLRLETRAEVEGFVNRLKTRFSAVGESVVEECSLRGVKDENRIRNLEEELRAVQGMNLNLKQQFDESARKSKEAMQMAEKTAMTLITVTILKRNSKYRRMNSQS